MAKRKNLLIIPAIVIMTIIISLITPMSVYADDELYEPRLTAPSQSIAYYSSLNYYAMTGTPMPNCVAYAYGRIYEMNGEAPLLTHGNAGEWWGMNIAGGYYQYGQQPKLGAIACWSNHVAVVEQINADGSVTLSESHWGGTYFDTVTYTDMSSHYGQSFYGFIYAYNNGISQDLKRKLLSSGNEQQTITFGTDDKLTINDISEHALNADANNDFANSTLEQIQNI